MNEQTPFAHNIALGNSEESYLCFQLTLFDLSSRFFFLYQSLSSSLCTDLNAISLNVDKVLSFKLSANVFVLRLFFYLYL